MKPYDTAIVIGGGAFGTSVAFVLAYNFRQVVVKVRSRDVYDAMLEGENSVYLPGIPLSPQIVPALTWEEATKEGKVELIVMALPTMALFSYCRENTKELNVFLKKGIPFVSLSKGIDPETLELPDELFFRYFKSFQDQFCFLSGPSFAKEILDKQITLVTLAGRSRPVLDKTALMLSTDFFKVFKSYDVKGVLLGGALKNVIAIAVGIAEGRGLNHNTRAALITRAIREMLRFGFIYNARPETFYGLSGMGDLILTATGELSRNKQFGFELAKGRCPKEIIASQRSVVEGYKTAKSIYLLSKKYAVQCLLFQLVYKILYEELPLEKAIKILIDTPPRFEIEI
ncbi:MAG: NAD(P)-dependent glycerol-3-phosphate dehydrogenase [Bacteriovoracales bacterium]|nr:NAD(P)-dependent glycerol-3-phosphate dehydrogenase [Bacteriovoracales bacterium]